MGPVNGLICLELGTHLFLRNSSISKSKKFPDSIAMLKFGRYMYGFGYDELHNTYKVVGIFCHTKGGYSCDVTVEIYNSMSDSWKRFDDFQCGLLHLDSTKLVNEKLHWVTNYSFHGWRHCFY